MRTAVFWMKSTNVSYRRTYYNRPMAKKVVNNMTKQRVAIVCDWLTEVGGGEKVILAVHEMFPEAPIYTSQYRPKRAT